MCGACWHVLCWLVYVCEGVGRWDMCVCVCEYNVCVYVLYMRESHM